MILNLNNEVEKLAKAIEEASAVQRKAVMDSSTMNRLDAEQTRKVLERISTDTSALSLFFFIWAIVFVVCSAIGIYQLTRIARALEAIVRQ